MNNDVIAIATYSKTGNVAADFDGRTVRFYGETGFNMVRSFECRNLDSARAMVKNSEKLGINSGRIAIN